MKINVGVVGATGVVGEEFLKLLEERHFPLNKLKLFASQESAGKQLTCFDKKWPVEVIQPGCFTDLDVTFFSSGDDISREWAPMAVKEGSIAIDNSAAFRMNPDISLIVPEINGHLLPSPAQAAIIANPNCSTIQLVHVLSPLQKSFGLSQVKVSTYQAVSGAGKAGKDELIDQLEAEIHHRVPPVPKTFPHPIAFNCIPQIGRFDSQGFCGEEVKIMNETRKILTQSDLKISAFTVRVPALNGHSEAVWITLKKEILREEIVSCLQKYSPTIQIQDDLSESLYPQAREASGKNPVYVGRIHSDPQDSLTWMMWIVADNLRVGAALNGIRIAERIFQTSLPS